MESFWIIASYVTLGYAALVSTVLVVVYAFTQWEKTQVGRQFMATKACLAVILDYWFATVTLIHQQFNYSVAMPARAIICTVVGTIMLRWLIIVIRVRHRTQRSHHPVWNAPEEPPPVRSEQ